MKSYTAFQPVFIAIILLFFQPRITFSQDEEKLKDMFVEAESYFLFEEYKDALPLYQRMLATNPDNFNINYKIGVCYLNDIYQISKSIPHLEKAVKGTSAQSKPTSFKETRAPLEALYYLGNAYRANNKLKEAIATYEQFKLVLDPMVYDVTLVEQQISACHTAAEQQNNPMYFISSNMGEGINDRFEEINPVISGDENVIAFTRRLQFYDAVFISRRENGKWSEPVNLTQEFGLDGNSYTTGLSWDGDEIFVYRSDDFDGNLYSSRYRNGSWSKLEKLNGNINTKYWESHASVSKDGKTLYFTSNRDGGYGGLDIYRSQRTRNGEWGPAVNLGPVINSKYNEDTPFITDDGNTLYFSSMGHYNMGGYDIFYSTRLDGGQWAKPVNGGYPLNTTRDDLFFVPVKDGAYAYYSKYDPESTFGMADIYKLEVFTELHPRKFILKGITRVDGNINPAYNQYTAVLTNPRTGKVLDQSRLNPDGTYTLNALSGEYNLEIKGDGIINNEELINIPVDNPSNIIAHSSLLAVASTPQPQEVLPAVQEVPPAAPELNIPVASYNVTTNEPIPIRLDLEKNTKLKVATIIDGKLVKNEEFNIRRNKFIYMLTPQPGVNTLHLSLINAAGDSTVRDVTVIYTPEPGEITPALLAKNVLLPDSDRYNGLASLSAGKLQEYIRTIDLKNMDFKSVADIYDYLVNHAGENGYLVQDVDELMKKFLSQKEINAFYEEMKAQASDSISKTLENSDLKSNNIFTADALLDYLYVRADTDTSNYTLQELRNTLYKIAALGRSPNEFISLLESYSEGELATLLGRMNQNGQDYSDNFAVSDAIIKAAENKEFPLSQLESMLRQAAADLNVQFLNQSLIFISGNNLKQSLLELKLEDQGIRNSQEFISYMMNNAEKRNYSKRELFENIEKVRSDPYYFVDLFRKMLAEKATGSLKEFINEIDIRNLNISTYEQLLDYLLSQSQFHDYNREMVYQLLIDIINPKNVAEFISLLKQYADSNIVSAVDAADASQFSKPLEVMQYLLSVAEQYKYTERDLLRVLLKMVLSKGPASGDGVEKQGWLSRIDRPAMIAALVVVNGLIVLLLILFIVRKKRRNE